MRRTLFKQDSRRSEYWWWVGIIVLLFAAGCGDRLGAYENRFSCTGVLPTRETRPQDIQILWQDITSQWLLSDVDGAIHVWNEGQTPEDAWDLETASPSIISVSPALPLVGVVSRSANGPLLTVRNLGDRQLGYLEIEIPNAPLPTWHATEPMIAFSSLSESSEPNRTDQVAVVNLETGLSSRQEFELRYTVSHIQGWSYDGRVLAIAQETPSGLRPTYLYLDDNEFTVSEFSQFDGNCVQDGSMSPQKNRLLFSGTTWHKPNYDLYFEEFDSQPQNDTLLVNLTNSPTEDDLMPAWSPNGERIVFVKAYVNESGTYIQDLYLISDLESGPVIAPLTHSEGQHRDALPFWLSEDEVVYFSWSIQELHWKIERVNLIDKNIHTIAIIPDVWVHSSR